MIRKYIGEGQIIPSYYGVAYPLWDRNQVVCYPLPFNWLVGVLVVVHGYLRDGFRRAFDHACDARTYQQGYDRGFADCAHGALIERRGLERQITAAHDTILSLRVLLVTSK